MKEQDMENILGLLTGLGDGDLFEEGDEYPEQSDGSPSRASAGMAEHPLGLLVECPLEISVEIGRKRMTAGEFLRLGIGSVIPLSKVAGEPMEVFANGRKFALGDVVVVGDTFGIQITCLASDRALGE